MRKTLLLAVLLGSVGAPAAHAQSANLSPRVDKLEKEMRAVQRKVFPGGSTQFLEPEIAAPVRDVDQAGSPASTPLADLSARVSALESQLQSLTGQIEQNSYKTRQLDEAFKAYKAEMDARLKALEGGGEPVSTPGAVSGTGSVKPPAVSSVAPTKPSGDRKAALEAIQKPTSSDPGEDAYLYGYRLWEAKFYPEAQAQLKLMVEKYPKHSRVTFAQNLLGRAYLDEGKPALAAVAFYDNYQKQPKGARAPDSLFHLGQSLTRLKKLPDACKVFDEFDQVYGATATASLKAQVVKGRTEAKCK